MLSENIRKIVRYIQIYGLNRTINKVSGRLRKYQVFTPRYLRKNPEVGLIGCGQFQFSTIAYFLSKGLTNRFAFCYDIDAGNSESLGRFYGIPTIPKTLEELLDQDKVSTVYIASNHASHSYYARMFLEKNIDVYCEKPISVSFSEFDLLLAAMRRTKASFYAGYNRPYSSAVNDLKKEFDRLENTTGQFTLSCFISAHDIPPDHWYRNEDEGTRICGNVGHWLDLMIHIYHWRGHIPKEYQVQVAYSNRLESDDNITISITTDLGDLTSITITARSEPFEGINETINFQYQTIIAKIDDFRRMKIWNREHLHRKRYWPKDVGHRRSVMQPFRSDNRDLNEVIASTELMLNIMEMVKNTEIFREVSLTRTL